MGFKCLFVRRKLAAALPGEALPKSTAAHLAKCEGCAAEARAYARLETLLTAEREDSHAPEWEVLRSRLSNRPRVAGQKPRMLPIGAAAFALAAIALTIVVWPRTAPMSVSPSKPIRVAVYHPKSIVVSQRKPTAAKPSQPKTNSRSRLIIETKSNRIQRFRRYKPWKLTAQAPEPKQEARPVKREVVASTDDSAVSRPPEYVDSPAQTTTIENGGSKYVIDMVAADDADYASL